MTNNILDKLGIYDLIVLLLSGICITSFSIILYPIVFSDQLTNCIKPEDTLAFLAISYFVGLVFQEIGAFFFRKCLNHNRRLLLYSFCSTKKSEYVLTPKERSNILHSIDKTLLNNPNALENYTLKDKENTSKVKKSFTNVFKKSNDIEQTNSVLIQNIDILYNYCKSCVIANKNSSKIDSNQSTAGMSRSLGLYFCLLSFSTALHCICTSSLDNALFLIAFVAFALILFYRSIRFTLIRYTYIFRTYYYTCYLNKEDKKKD